MNTASRKPAPFTENRKECGTPPEVQTDLKGLATRPCRALQAGKKQAVGTPRPRWELL
jgi:hypothetical protein